jgi:GAF domain-containing protein
MNLMQMISPTNPPAHIKAHGELAVNRERILQTILVVILSASVIGYIGLLVYSLPRQQYGWVILYTGLTILIFAYTVYRRMAYPLRTMLLTLTILATTIFTFATTGLEGNGGIYLLAFIALTTILLGWKAGVFSLIFTHLIFLTAGILIVQNKLLLPVGLDALTKDGLTDWIRTGVLLTIVSTTITLSLAMLIRGFETSYLRAESLSQNLLTEQVGLQARVEQRTNEIKARMQQILTASEVSQIIVSQHDPDQLLPQIVDLLHDRFELYYVGVFIVDDANNAVLRAGSGDAGKNMIAAGHYLPVDGTSMIGWAITNNQTRIAQDVGAESVRFNNPYLPETRSELAIPILRQGESLGAISIQSRAVNVFDEDDISIFESIANALAIALENTQLFTQAQNALDEVRSLNRGYMMRAWSELANETGNLSFSYDNYQANSGVEPNVVEIPLSLRDQTIGSITLEMEDENLTTEQRDFIDAITTQTALALENARLINEIQRHATQEQILNDLTSDFSLATNIEDILKTALRQLGEIPAVSEASIQLAPPAKNIPKWANGNGHTSPVTSEDNE